MFNKNMLFAVFVSFVYLNVYKILKNAFKSEYFLRN